MPSRVTHIAPRRTLTMRFPSFASIYMDTRWEEVGQRGVDNRAACEGLSWSRSAGRTSLGSTPHRRRSAAHQGSPRAATLHCLTGRAIGEVLGVALATWWGWGDRSSIALAVVRALRHRRWRRTMARRSCGACSGRRVQEGR